MQNGRPLILITQHERISSEDQGCKAPPTLPPKLSWPTTRPGASIEVIEDNNISVLESYNTVRETRPETDLQGPTQQKSSPLHDRKAISKDIITKDATLEKTRAQILPQDVQTSMKLDQHVLLHVNSNQLRLVQTWNFIDKLPSITNEEIDAEAKEKFWSKQPQSAKSDSY